MPFKSTVFAKGFVLSVQSYLSLKAKDSCRCSLLAKKALNFLNKKFSEELLK